MQVRMVPVSKSSLENVPINGMSMWVCPSIIPGITRTVKERTKRFWNNFRSDDWRRVHRFVFLFAFWYNFVRIHSRFDRPPGDVIEWLQEVMPQLS